MASKKKKAAKKKAEAEAPPADEPEPTEDDTEPETADPFAEDAEGETEAKAESEDGDEEEKPVAPPDRPTVTFAEKHAQKRGDKPKEGDAKKGSIVDWLAKVQYTADDIESVAYYANAGLSVLTMSDGKKFDVTD